MTSWTADELDPISGEDELRIATRRADGSLRAPLRIWFVRAGDVTFEEADHALDEELHRAYREKYARYPASIVATVVSDEAARCTLRVVRA